MSKIKRLKRADGERTLYSVCRRTFALSAMSPVSLGGPAVVLIATNIIISFWYTFDAEWLKPK